MEISPFLYLEVISISVMLFTCVLFQMFFLVYFVFLFAYGGWLLSSLKHIFSSLFLKLNSFDYNQSMENRDIIKAKANIGQLIFRQFNFLTLLYVIGPMI